MAVYILLPRDGIPHFGCVLFDLPLPHTLSRIEILEQWRGRGRRASWIQFPVGFYTRHAMPARVKVAVIEVGCRRLGGSVGGISRVGRGAGGDFRGSLGLGGGGGSKGRCGAVRRRRRHDVWDGGGVDVAVDERRMLGIHWMVGRVDASISRSWLWQREGGGGESQEPML